RLGAGGLRRGHPASLLGRTGTAASSAALPVRAPVVPPLAVSLVHGVSPSLYPSTWRAVTAATRRISSSEQPRERSFAGFDSPCRIGPTAVAPAIRSTSL